MTALTLSPTARPSSAMASIVMEAVTVSPWPISMRTYPVVWPAVMPETVPGRRLRAESRMASSPDKKMAARRIGRPSLG